jgi:hypothetical protein
MPPRWAGQRRTAAPRATASLGSRGVNGGGWAQRSRERDFRGWGGGRGRGDGDCGRGRGGGDCGHGVVGETDAEAEHACARLHYKLIE